MELFEFIVSNNLIDVNADFNNWFCKAVIYNSLEIATYLKDFFKTEPNLNLMKYQGESVFFNIVKTIHYSGIKNHYYLYSMLNDEKFILSDEEKKN